MKKLGLLLGLILLTLQGSCQEDKTFKQVVIFEQGFKFSPTGPIQNTPYLGGSTGTVYWKDILEKPATYPPDVHNHDLLYRPISWVPTWNEILNKPVEQELKDAIPALQGIAIPRLTTTQIGGLTPVEGLMVYDLTLHVMKYWNGTVWKVIVTAN